MTVGKWQLICQMQHYGADICELKLK